ncbi:polysaccharide deacetylase family protein [uncultured Roseibium sp.]|uniref:polysaccharide deacetylase family protein n=1 Tax=uncultured Roseibium sp. TaxID=1936171 RepID=UPI0026078B97|nr:polysaccharide deacetylase family protein [uncultured Roseibium sp.]
MNVDLLPAKNSGDRSFSEVSLRLSAGAKARGQIKALGLKSVAKSGLATLVGKVYGGKGVILMFHEFTHCLRKKLGSGCHVDDFEAILRSLRRSGRDIVSLSEAVHRIEDPASRPFAVLTFDDGYLCNTELALPIMERYEAPAAIFVPTEAITRTINAWWLGLRDIVQKNDSVDFAPMKTRFLCPDYASKVATLRHLVAWVWEDFHRADMLEEVFRENGASLPDLAEEFFMTENQMIEADRHPLIEIAAHTTTHRALGLLSEEEVRRDIGDNKEFLEERLERDVPHFAFPYGRPSLTGRREAGIAKEFGFQTSVTTDPGCLFPQHGDELHMLPRDDGEYAGDGYTTAVCSMNGVFRAISSRGGSPVVNCS